MQFFVPDGFYTVTQAARILGIGTTTLRFHINQRNIDAVEVDPGTPRFHRLISQESIDEFRRRRGLDPSQKHLYEIICITCGVTDVLFSTDDLFKLSQMYTRMIERDHKFVRIRLDGVPLLIFESDRLGNSFHPRTKKGASYVQAMERSEGAAAGHLSGHEQVGVLHGKESEVLRCRACGVCETTGGRCAATEGEPKEPVRDEASSVQRNVQAGVEPAGREKLSGIPVRPGGRGYQTPEERRRKAAERMRRWRKENPDKSAANCRRYRERRKRKEEENDPGAKGQ